MSENQVQIEKNKLLLTNKISLQYYLFFTIVPTLLIPLLIACIVSYQIIRDNSVKQLRQKVEQEALLAQKSFSLAIDSAIDISVSVASNPAVLSAIQKGIQKVETEQLNLLAIAEAEKKYAETKTLLNNTALNNYLKQTMKKLQQTLINLPLNLLNKIPIPNSNKSIDHIINQNRTKTNHQRVNCPDPLSRA